MMTLQNICQSQMLEHKLDGRIDNERNLSVTTIIVE